MIEHNWKTIYINNSKIWFDYCWFDWFEFKNRSTIPHKYNWPYKLSCNWVIELIEKSNYDESLISYLLDKNIIIYKWKKLKLVKGQG